MSYVLSSGDVFTPLLLEDEHGVSHANDWASGFMRGMELVWGFLLNACATVAPSRFYIKSSATMAQLATPICRDKDGWGRSHSCSFDHRRRPETFRTAMATACRWGHGDLSFLLLLGVMPRCPTSAKLFSAVDRRRAWVVLDLC